MKGRILIIAGSDSGGGAGIQADIKTVTALDGFAMTAITALTAQNTLGVQGIFPIPPEFIAQQIRVVCEDLGVDAIKIGMLHSAAVIEAVAMALPDAVPVVLDPVMVAKGGAPLLEASAQQALITRLIPRATLITPNWPEAAVLLGCPLEWPPNSALNDLLALGAGAVLLKGGHCPQKAADGTTRVYDYLVTRDLADSAPLTTVFEKRFIETRHTHGTGCTLSSAIATGLGQQLTLMTALQRANDYLERAILMAPGYGRGHGPLNHHPTSLN